MKLFLIRIIQFGTAVVIVYFFLALCTANIPALETRWDLRPNFAHSNSAKMRLQSFDSFCKERAGETVNVILGSSVAHHGIDPQVLGRNWFNAATQAQNIMLSQIFADALWDAALRHEVQLDTILFDIYPYMQQGYMIESGDATWDMATSLPWKQLVSNRDFLLDKNAFSRLNARIINYLPNLTRTPSILTPSNELLPILRGHHKLKKRSEFSFAYPQNDFRTIDSSIILMSFKYPEQSNIALLNPPTLHANHKNALMESAKWLQQYQLIEGYLCNEVMDSTYFNDSHHMNEDGARVYSTWLRAQQLSNRP